MLITLIRDNIPAKAEADGVKLNATTAQHDDLFANLLNERLIDAISAYLSEGNIDALVETRIITDAIAELLGDKYQEVHNKQIEELGTYSKRYMVVQMQSTNATASETESTTPENDKV